MAQPEEFKIHIAADGRVTLENEGMTESSWRRIIELLEETIGPVLEVPLQPGEPPRVYLSDEARQRLEQRKS